MKIGIMGAMPEEIDSIHSHMSNVERVLDEFGGEYFCGAIGGHDIVLTLSGVGKVNATITATTLVARFQIQQLIFTGVAGAADPALNIGDLVVSDQLYQHDMDARPLFPRHEIPYTGTTFFRADAALIRKAHRVTNALLSSLDQTIPSLELGEFNITQAKCVVGTIATGDQFIGNPAITAAIVEEKPETVAVEMEGAAVAQVCAKARIPFVVIRTISDQANHESAVNFPRFIANIARRYSEYIVQGMLAKTPEQQPIDGAEQVRALTL